MTPASIVPLPVVKEPRVVRYSWPLVLLGWLVPVVGCNRGPATTALSGEVRFEGQAVEDGTIDFFPVDGTLGPSAAATIAQGRYALPAKGGVRVDGTYLVRIVGLRNSGRKVRNERYQPNGPPLEEKENFIPAIYNSESTMKVRVSELPDKNKADFQLGTTPFRAGR